MSAIDVLIDAALPAFDNAPDGFTAQMLADEIVRRAPEFLTLAGITREQFGKDVDRCLRRRYGPHAVDDEVPTIEAFAAMTREEMLRAIADLDAQAERDRAQADALQAFSAMKFGPARAA